MIIDDETAGQVTSAAEGLAAAIDRFAEASEERDVPALSGVGYLATLADRNRRMARVYEAASDIDRATTRLFVALRAAGLVREDLP